MWRHRVQGDGREDVPVRHRVQTDGQEDVPVRRRVQGARGVEILAAGDSGEDKDLWASDKRAGARAANNDEGKIGLEASNEGAGSLEAGDDGGGGPVASCAGGEWGNDEESDLKTVCCRGTGTLEVGRG
ncbi:hypothetical protein AMECASPLE_020008 [Ameca splendens]|uniref:Uncharacterized protein n=1 Tax=Ameca splendens TaxID=208324 RepID=A0ABV0YF81_9TELE